MQINEIKQTNVCPVLGREMKVIRGPGPQAVRFRSNEFQGDKRSGTRVAKPGAAIDEKQTCGIKRCGQIRLLPVVAQALCK